jgi:hypothetical protein
VRHLLLALIACVGLSGCVALGGTRLESGVSDVYDVERALGAPAMRWEEADGHQLLAFPTGPAGFQTYMVRIGPDEVLESIENVLTTKYFARIRPNMTQDEILRLIGPPQPHWTVYFERRDELVWEWRYCDDWNEPARFNVLFDGTSKLVRSTLSQTESLRGLFWRDRGRQWCSQ